MKLGINIPEKGDYKEVIEALAENNIKRTFLISDHPEFDNVMKLLREKEIIVDSMHAPYKNISLMWSENDDEGNGELEELKKSVDRCSENGVKILVIHPSTGRNKPDFTKVGLERFKILTYYAKNSGVTIALENHRFADLFDCLFREIPDMGFCYDTGHESNFTSGIEYMPDYGERVVALHINDNECIFDHDQHMIPFDGNIDWEKVAGYLSQYAKDCTLMLEIKKSNHNMYDKMSVREYYKRATEHLKKLDSMI